MAQPGKNNRRILPGEFIFRSGLPQGRNDEAVKGFSHALEQSFDISNMFCELTLVVRGVTNLSSQGANLILRGPSAHPYSSSSAHVQKNFIQKKIIFIPENYVFR